MYIIYVGVTTIHTRLFISDTYLQYETEKSIPVFPPVK